MVLATVHAFSTAFSQSDFFGKFIFLGLFILSFICWMTLLYKMWIMKEVKKNSSKLLYIVEKQKSNLLNISIEPNQINTFKEIPQPFLKIFSGVKSKTLEILEKNHYFVSEIGHPKSSVYLSRSDIELVENQLVTTIINQKEQLEKNLFILSTITTLAPFVGLLGTVWGILVTFSGLQMSGNFASNTVILGGLSTALATTVMGLLIAIPSLVSYNYLRQTIKTYTCQMNDFGHFLLSTIEIQYRKVDLS
jgi:biopolymer transport protein TolQ